MPVVGKFGENANWSFFLTFIRLNRTNIGIIKDLVRARARAQAGKEVSRNITKNEVSRAGHLRHVGKHGCKGRRDGLQYEDKCSYSE